MKFREFIQNRRAWLVLVLLGVGLGGFGCASTGDEPENVSSKPWNSPEGWQNGNLPSMLQQPH
ncbi:MAG TPA: hypothetical protein VG754_12235 [Verrucomicrobiae bacterium]|jgi:hypothetical protein|nr:hypothetical protein [Verrucomicrobiae bacterium]